MRAESPAPAILRSLFALERSKGSGVLVVRAPGKEARIGIVAGRPTAIAVSGGFVAASGDAGAVSQTLGDMLDAAGAFDHEAHAAALAAGEPQEAIGSWLVRHAVCTQADIDAALLTQLVARLAAVFQLRSAECRFWPGDGDVGLPSLVETLAVGPLVLRAVRVLAATTDRTTAKSDEADGTLTRLGRAVAEDATLSAAELRALASLGLMTSSDVGQRSFATLLRKQRQVRNGVDAFALLDLPAGAHVAEARRALRRLAQAVHPDRYGDSVPAAVRTVAQEVMAALLDAERSIVRGAH